MIHIYVAIGLAAAAVLFGYLGHAKGTKTDLYDLYVEAARPSELGAGVPGFFGGSVAAVDGQQQLVAQYSKQPCVWYSFTLEQEYMQRSANGVETPEWRVISQTQPQGVLFALQTADGSKVLVNPGNAQVDTVQQYEGFVESQADGVLGGIANAVSALGNNRVRVREQYIPLGQQLYAGGVAQDQDGQKVFANDQSYPLVLTTQSKADLVKSGQRTSVIEYVMAGVLLAGAFGVMLFFKK